MSESDGRLMGAEGHCGSGVAVQGTAYMKGGRRQGLGEKFSAGSRNKGASRGLVADGEVWVRRAGGTQSRQRLESQ